LQLNMSMNGTRNISSSNIHGLHRGGGYQDGEEGPGMYISVATRLNKGKSSLKKKNKKSTRVGPNQPNSEY